MNKKFLSVIIFTMIVAVSLTGCDYNLSFNAKVLKKEDAKKFTMEKSKVDTITQIDIHTRIADVEVIPSDNFYVQINYLYWEEEPEYSLKDGKLYFDDRDAIPNSYSINFNLNNTIQIYLPENASLDNLEVDSSSGDVSLSSFVANDLDVNISYGDLIMEKAAAVNTVINLSSGDSEFTDFQTGKMDFKSSYGDADFKDINTGDSRLASNVTFEDFDIDSSSGDITINGLYSDSVSINDSYGQMTCEGITADRFTSELSSGDTKISNSMIDDINVRSSYGDADLDLSGTEADYTMDLSTSYGNIRVGGKNYDEHYNLENDAQKHLSASLSSGDITVNYENN